MVDKLSHLQRRILTSGSCHFSLTKLQIETIVFQAQWRNKSTSSLVCTFSDVFFSTLLLKQLLFENARFYNKEQTFC
jgi:hypothetical protein